MYDADRRKHPRFKVSVSVEINVEGDHTPIRWVTSDISLDGCYVESMFPFPVGTSLELKLQLETTLVILAKVVTSYPQVGNGIRFVRILPEDLDELRSFLGSLVMRETAETQPSSICNYQ
ncbi:MAG: PilZ domain-containing protein [Terriglobales bacterium]